MIKSLNRSGTERWMRRASQGTVAAVKRLHRVILTPITLCAWVSRSSRSDVPTQPVIHSSPPTNAACCSGRLLDLCSVCSRAHPKHDHKAYDQQNNRTKNIRSYQDALPHRSPNLFDQTNLVVRDDISGCDIAPCHLRLQKEFVISQSCNSGRTTFPPIWLWVHIYLIQTAHPGMWQ